MGRVREVDGVKCPECDGTVEVDGRCEDCGSTVEEAKVYQCVECDTTHPTTEEAEQCCDVDPTVIDDEPGGEDQGVPATA